MSSLVEASRLNAYVFYLFYLFKKCLYRFVHSELALHRCSVRSGDELQKLTCVPRDPGLPARKHGPVASFIRSLPDSPIRQRCDFIRRGICKVDSYICMLIKIKIGSLQSTLMLGQESLPIPSACRGSRAFWRAEDPCSLYCACGTLMLRLLLVECAPSL